LLKRRKAWVHTHLNGSNEGSILIELIVKKIILGILSKNTYLAYTFLDLYLEVQ
jgi:hypothetical protein